MIFLNLKKQYCIECFKILQIYLCINDKYTVIFSNENIRSSASYPPSPESSKKKSSATAAVIVAFTMPEIKKTKNLIELEYIFYTMTLDCKKIKMQQNGGVLKKKIKILLKNLMVFGVAKLHFSFNHKPGWSLYVKTLAQ